jgi:hypothetical protein
VAATAEAGQLTVLVALVMKAVLAVVVQVAVVKLEDELSARQRKVWVELAGASDVSAQKRLVAGFQSPLEKDVAMRGQVKGATRAAVGLLVVHLSGIFLASGTAPAEGERQRGALLHRKLWLPLRTAADAAKSLGEVAAAGAPEPAHASQ